MPILSSKVSRIQRDIFSHLAAMVYYLHVRYEELLRKVLTEIGRRGGHARAKALTAKERKAIATKASKAAAKARTLKAKRILKNK